MTTNFVRHLNFFDEKLHGAKEVFALNYLWILVIVGLSASVGAGYYFFEKKHLESLQEELETVTAQNAELQSVQAKQQQASLSATARKEVLGDPVLWSGLLSKMVRQVPDAIKITSFAGTIGTKRDIVIKGLSPFVLPIFRLKDNFADLRECQKPALVSIEQAQTETGDSEISFQLECTLL